MHYTQGSLTKILISSSPVAYQIKPFNTLQSFVICLLSGQGEELQVAPLRQQAAALNLQFLPNTVCLWRQLWVRGRQSCGVSPRVACRSFTQQSLRCERGLAFADCAKMLAALACMCVYVTSSVCEQHADVYGDGSKAHKQYVVERCTLP